MSDDGRVGSDSPIVGVEGVLRGWPGPEGLTDPTPALASTPNTPDEATSFDRKLKEAALAAVGNVDGPEVMRPGKMIYSKNPRMERLEWKAEKLEAQVAAQEEALLLLIDGINKLIQTVTIHNDILELRHA